MRLWARGPVVVALTTAGITAFSSGASYAGTKIDNDDLSSGFSSLSSIASSLTGHAPKKADTPKSQTEAGTNSPGGKTSGAFSLLGGNQIRIPISAPIHICGNAVSVAGVAKAACQGGTHVLSRGPGNGDWETTGKLSLLGGNQIRIPISAPIHICGNTVAALGRTQAACTGGATLHDEGGTGQSNSSGEGSTGGGNQISAPISAPIDISGNAVSGLGDAEAANNHDATAPTTGEVPGTGTPAAEPTTNNPKTGPTTQDPKTGPTTNNPESGPTTQDPKTGPTTNNPETGPTTNNPKTGPTTNNSETGPTTQDSETCPTTEDSETCPTMEGPETGPLTTAEGDSPRPTCDGSECASDETQGDNEGDNEGDNGHESPADSNAGEPGAEEPGESAAGEPTAGESAAGEPGTEESGARDLPFTGSPVGALTGAGLLLITAGGVLIGGRRLRIQRRR